MRLGPSVVDDRGDSLVTFVLIAPALLLMIGAVYDFGSHFESRLHAKHTAAAAARMGANQIVEDSLYQGQTVRLNDSAAQLASEFAEGQGFDDAEATVPKSDRVTVTISGQTETTFLTIIGVDQLDFTVSETAVARYGGAREPVTWTES